MNALFLNHTEDTYKFSTIISLIEKGRFKVTKRDMASFSNSIPELNDILSMVMNNIPFMPVLVYENQDSTIEVFSKVIEVLYCVYNNLLIDNKGTRLTPAMIENVSFRFVIVKPSQHDHPNLDLFGKY